MSKRSYTLFSLGLALLLGAALFVTSERVQHAQRDLAEMRTKVGIERDSLRILKAEWTFLNRPDRLETLAQTYLNLSPVKAAQIVSTPASIPEPITPILPSEKPVQAAITAPAEDIAMIAATKTPPKNTAAFNALITRVSSPVTP